MTQYTSNAGTTLLTGAVDPDGDPITIARINGQIPSSWPHVLTLPVGTVSITQAGVVTYDDGNDISGHPLSGSTAGNGSFTFTLTDGQDESPAYTADVSLTGISVVSSGGVADAGFDPFIDAGTSFDYYVDDVNGSDSNSGTSVGSAKSTIQAAVNAAVSAGGKKTIGVRAVSGGGVYRESIDISFFKGPNASNKCVLSGYGTEKPRITGGEVVSNWTQCTSSRQGLLGSGYANVYEHTFNIANTLAFTNNDNNLDLSNQGTLKAIWGINPFERLSNGSWVPLNMAGLRTHTATRRFQSRIDYMYAADQFLQSNNNPVTANGQTAIKIKDSNSSGAGVNIASLNSTALGQAFCRIKHNPTVVSNISIASVSGDTITLTSGVNASYTGGDGRGRSYMIANYAHNMPQGTWVVTDNGNGTATLFVRPHENSSISNNRIEMSVRSKGIFYKSISSSADHVIVQNMEIVQAGGVHANYSYNIGGRISGGSIFGDGFELRNIFTGRMDGSSSTERGENIRFDRMNNVTVDRLEMVDTDGTYGIARTTMDGGRFFRIKGTNIGNTPMRGLKITNHIDAYCDFDTCGQGQHSNQGEYKQGSFNCWMHGIRSRNPLGYYNFQAATDLFYTMNDIAANTQPDQYAGVSGQRDKRCFEDQGGTAPRTGGKVWLYNNHFQLAPDVLPPGNVGGVRLSSGGHDVRFELHNNILSGGVSDVSKIGSRGNNIYVGLDWYQSGSLAPESGSITNLNANQVFANPSAGNFAPAPGSPLLSKTGSSLATLRSLLTGIFGSTIVDDLLTRDIYGKPLTSGLVGPLDDPSDWQP